MRKMPLWHLPDSNIQTHSTSMPTIHSDVEAKTCIALVQSTLQERLCWLTFHVINPANSILCHLPNRTWHNVYLGASNQHSHKSVNLSPTTEFFSTFEWVYMASVSFGNMEICTHCQDNTTSSSSPEASEQWPKYYLDSFSQSYLLLFMLENFNNR